MISLLDLYVRKEYPQFDTLADELKESFRRIYLKGNYRFSGRASYAHFKHIFGTYSNNTFTVESNEHFSIRHYRYPAISDDPCTCVTHVRKNELVGAQYIINLENL